MMGKTLTIVLVLLTTIISFCFTKASDACSVFKVIAKDGTIISARTMEFGVDAQYGLIVVPRGKAFTSPAPNNKTGITWKTRYGYVASNVFGDESLITDGLNENGLAFSALWYEADTKWQKIESGETKMALAHSILGSWILGNFKTVDEVKKSIKKVKVFGFYLAKLGMTVPLHSAVYDATGSSVVIEYDNGEPHVYDNPLGVMTNSPNFPWMVNNLRNYIGMSPEALEEKNFAGINLRPTGHGAGMWGLPGDITPPSRFVRLAVTTHFADQQKNAAELLNLAQHIVSTIHIVRGMVVDRDKDGKIIASETTQWSSYRDLTNRIFYFRTYDNFNLRKIDLKKIDFNSIKFKSIPMYEDVEEVKDLTNRLR